MTGVEGTAPAGDARPRPQYGEYASPEEQRARIKQPDVTWALETGEAVAEAPAAPATALPDAATGSRPRMIDRIVTFALLVYGLINVVSIVPALWGYVAYAQTMFDMLGVEATLTDPEAAKPWGMAAALVQIFGWLITAALSWARMRRGRLSWWIPLVGGIVFTFISATLVLVPLMNDPAVRDILVGSLG
ncbi:hypothetical protein ASD56_13995 [Microbacterium sp. Root166]|uniref:DUF6264 family protein n=1 Tax=Microbacterium sp. Root166 TaxID=1736478 RepID=UPI0006F4DA5C|nr:DUF6264 family protein [Microbacterium sp. Root166]KQZ83393.1 hypothetical protein ASD56_13995 [Microbacterium sp. Root166]